jgi:hypothetical protein
MERDKKMEKMKIERQKDVTVDRQIYIYKDVMT